MLVVKFSCHNQRLRRINLCMIPSNAYNNVKFQFDFRTDDWDAVETKFVNLYYNGTNHEIALDKNNQCYLQEDIIYSPKISVSVFGGDIITNTIAIPVDENIKVNINTNIYDNLIDLIKNHTHEEYVEDDEIGELLPDTIDAGSITERS